MHAMMNVVENGRTTVWATYLLLSLPVVNVVSPTLTGVLEAVLYLLFLVTPELRKRFVAGLCQPMVICGFCLYFIVMASSFWSAAEWADKLEVIKGCRKILVLPMAIALINSPFLKDRFLLVFIFSVTAVAFLSWVSWISGITIHKPATALLRNDVTQGMTFFVAAFASACMVAYHKGLASHFRRILTVCFLVVASNGVMISTGRSGYLLGIVLVGCFGLYAGGKKSLVITPLLVAVTAGLFYLSPTPRHEITMAVNNLVSGEHADENTSAGLRVVFWKNTLPVITQSPVIGHGLKGLRAEYAKQVAGVEGWQGIVTDDPHNQYLFMLAEQGAVGLIVFLAFVASFFFQKTEPLYRLLGLSILVGWMATSLFNGHFSSSVEGRFVLLWCAAMLSMPLATRVSRSLTDRNVAGAPRRNTMTKSDHAGGGILVTGGAGYIGAHAVHHLCDAGYRPVVLDDLSTGCPDNLPGDAPFIEGDVGDAGLLAGIFTDHRIAAVMHFAGSILVSESVVDPGHYYANNTANTLTLVRQMAACNISRLIFSSSAAVYGTPVRDETPMDEDTPTRPVNPYGFSKLMSEWIIRDVARVCGMRVANPALLQRSRGRYRREGRGSPLPGPRT